MTTSQPEQPDQVFFDLADTFIELANHHTAKVGKGKASAALSFAAARFNAFVAATAVTSGDALRARQDEAITYFSGQYRNMLQDNLTDWADNFDAYRKPGPA